MNTCSSKIYITVEQKNYRDIKKANAYYQKVSLGMKTIALNASPSNT